MERIELKYLASYLPYDIKVTNGKETVILDLIKADHLKYAEEFKLVLRPLSDLTKEIEINGKKFVPQNEFYILYGDGVSESNKELWKKIFIEQIKHSTYGIISYEIMQNLLEWHFDIFGLIPKGLAIDINEQVIKK